MVHRDIMARSLWFFAAVFLTGVSLATIISLFAARYGGFEQPTVIVANALLVAIAVTLPLAALTAQHDYQLRVHRRLLETMASTDPLTGVLNRRTFEIAAEEEMARMRGTAQGAAVLMFEIDGFRAVRDRNGSVFADRALGSIAQAAHLELRSPFDKLARWGDDRFVILLANVSTREARIVADRLRNTIAKHTVRQGRFEDTLTASFGYALLQAEGAVPEAIASAGRALCRARDAGGNSVMGAATLQAVA